MPVNSVAENAFGYLGESHALSPSDMRSFTINNLIPGAICWTVQLIPQIWKSWRTKSTEGLSHWLVYVY